LFVIVDLLRKDKVQRFKGVKSLELLRVRVAHRFVSHFARNHKRPSASTLFVLERMLVVFVAHGPMVAFETCARAKCGDAILDKFYSDVGSRLVAAKTISSHELPSASAGAGTAQGLVGTTRARCRRLGAAIHLHKATVAVLAEGASS
jgi:hypothetical protein